MRRIILSLLFAAAAPVFAQTAVPVVPAGGITIKQVNPFKTGWGFVTFVEAIPELNSCSAIVVGNSTYTQALWIDMTSNAPSGKQLYNTLFVAQLVGKRIEGMLILNQGWCDIHSARLVP